MQVPSNNVVPITPQGTEAPDPKYLAMAAGLMHQEGRLFEPAGPIATFATKPKVTDGHR